MRLRSCMIPVALLVLAGCAPKAPAPATELPLIPTQVLPEVDPPRAVLPDQTVIKLELALNDEDRRRGLMFRPSLSDNRGMLFCYEKPGDLGIWMKNTWIPLDIVFLDGTGTIIAITENAPPCPGEPCPTYSSGSPGYAVLEIAAGVAARHGLVVGTTIRFENVPDYPIVAATPAGDEAG